jgi:hypothetical protein
MIITVFIRKKNIRMSEIPSDWSSVGPERCNAELAINNESVMSDAVRHQMFQRSFTTKSGAGHGVGTYSVKKLTENYLHGTVEFHSAEAGGTTSCAAAFAV